MNSMQGIFGFLFSTNAWIKVGQRRTRHSS